MENPELRAVFERESGASEDRLTGEARIATELAMFAFMKRFNVFERKIAHPDRLTRGLFAHAGSLEEEDAIAWMGGAAKWQDVSRDLADRVKRLRGDAFYTFSAPDAYWKMGCGRSGYIQVRDGKVAAVYVTETREKPREKIGRGAPVSRPRGKRR